METNFVIMGLPASGKTTFLAALWHLVEAEEISCRLKLDRYEGDLTYLNRIAEAWRTFQNVPRTSQVGGDTNVTLQLVNRETGIHGTLFFPDLAGETFDVQVEARRCKPEFVDAVARDDGILFFLSADVRGNALSIVELNTMLPPGAAEQTPAVVEDQNAVEAPREWEPKLVPTQVRIVQILADLVRPPFEVRRRRLALVVSAWDLTDGMGVDPSTWLVRQMPLVSQFLRTNDAYFDYAVYGVSAQGLSLDNTAAIDTAAQISPSRRIRVVGPEGEGQDLTSPLLWLMSK